MKYAYPHLARRCFWIGLLFLLVQSGVQPLKAQTTSEWQWKDRVFSLEIQRSHEDILSLADSLLTANDPTSLADGQYLKGRALYHLDRNDDALQFVTSALESYEQLEDQAGIARALTAKGSMLRKAGKYPEAIVDLTKAESLWVALDQDTELGITQNERGVVHDYLSEYETALSFYESALKHLNKNRDKFWFANVINNIGILYDLQGQYDKAFDYYQQGLALREELNDQQGIAASLNNLGIVSRIQGKHDEALVYYQRALAIREEIGHLTDIATSLNNIGVLLDHLGRYDAALDYHHRSLAIKEELNNQRGVASSLFNIGNINFKHPESFGYLKKLCIYLLQDKFEYQEIASIGFLTQIFPAVVN